MADSDNLSNRPNYAAFWASLAAILLVAGGPWLWFRAHPPAPPPAPPKPLAAASFDDGVTVEILKAEVTAKLVFTPPGPSVPVKAPSTSRRGGSMSFATGASSGEEWKFGAEIFVAHEDSRLARAEISTLDGHPGLELPLRITNSGGGRFPVDHYAVGGERYPRNKVAPPTGTDLLDQTDMLFDVEDGAGGWLLCDGPVVFDAKEPFAFVYRANFPRRKPTLKFRARRHGHPAIEFEIPNPGYKPSFPTTTLNTAPVTTPEFTLKFERFLSSDSFPRRLKPEFTFEPAPGQTRGSFSYQSQLLDATGNSAHPVSSNAGSPLDQAFEWLPGERECRVVWIGTPTPAYAWKLNEVTVIAEGNCPDGATSTLSLTPGGRALGYSGATAEDLTRKDVGGGNRPTRRQYHVTLSAEAIQPSTLTRFDLKNIVVFSDGDRPIGMVRPNGSGSAGRTYSASYSWDGLLKPGDRFRVALVPVSALTPRRVEFIAEVPPLPPAAPAAPAEPAPAPR